MPQLNDELLGKVIGAILVNLMSVDYNNWLAMHFNEKGKQYNYVRNKLIQAAKSAEIVTQQLAISDPTSKEYIHEQVNMFSDIIFDLTSLDAPKIKRVVNLIEKIKKEAKNEA